MWIIPAYAGKRPGILFLNFLDKDHPRLRGEKDYRHKAPILYLGSSPLTRGKVLLASHHTHQTRIIPAYAGKRNDPEERSELCWDHPRLRGEKPWRKSISAYSRGSSPLTRGKVAALPPDIQSIGIIPAYAGKSRRRYFALQRSKDHPRLRGEKSTVSSYMYSLTGSSPLTRGKVA